MEITAYLVAIASKEDRTVADAQSTLFLPLAIKFLHGMSEPVQDSLDCIDPQ